MSAVCLIGAHHFGNTIMFSDYIAAPPWFVFLFGHVWLFTNIMDAFCSCFFITQWWKLFIPLVKKSGQRISIPTDFLKDAVSDYKNIEYKWVVDDGIIWARPKLRKSHYCRIYSSGLKWVLDPQQKMIVREELIVSPGLILNTLFLLLFLSQILFLPIFTDNLSIVLVVCCAIAFVFCGWLLHRRLRDFTNYTLSLESGVKWPLI